MVVLVVLPCPSHRQLRLSQQRLIACLMRQHHTSPLVRACDLPAWLAMQRTPSSRCSRCRSHRALWTGPPFTTAGARLLAGRGRPTPTRKPTGGSQVSTLHVRCFCMRNACTCSCRMCCMRSAAAACVHCSIPNRTCGALCAALVMLLLLLLHCRRGPSARAGRHLPAPVTQGRHLLQVCVRPALCWMHADAASTPAHAHGRTCPRLLHACSCPPAVF